MKWPTKDRYIHQSINPPREGGNNFVVWLLRGLCVHCGGKRDNGTKLCDDCRKGDDGKTMKAEAKG